MSEPPDYSATDVPDLAAFSLGQAVLRVSGVADAQAASSTSQRSDVLWLCPAEHLTDGELDSLISECVGLGLHAWRFTDEWPQGVCGQGTREAIRRALESPALQRLDFACCPELYHEWASLMRPSHGVEYLSACMVGLNSEDVEHIGRLSGLQTVCLTAAYSATEGWIEPLTRLKTLRACKLAEFASFSDAGASLLSTIHTLATLELPSHCDITDASVDALCNGRCSIEELSLSKCPITDESLVMLSNCRSLRRLQLFCCEGLTADAYVSLARSRPDLHCDLLLPRQYRDLRHRLSATSARIKVIG